MGFLPYGWLTHASLEFDYPDTEVHQWYLWLGVDGSVWDPRIPMPTAR